MIQKFWPICIVISYVLSCNIIKVNYFLYCFIILLHLISSFLHSKSLLIPYAHFSIELIDCILLSALPLNAILLTSSVNVICFMLLNLCWNFSINLLLLINSFWFRLRLSTTSLFFSKWFISF